MHSSKIGIELKAHGWNEQDGHADEMSIIDSQLAGLKYERREFNGIPIYVAPLDDGHVALMSQAYDTPPENPSRTEKGALDQTAKALNELALEYGNVHIYNLGRSELGSIVLDTYGVDNELHMYDYDMYDYSINPDKDITKSRLAKIKYEEKTTENGCHIFIGKTPGTKIVLTNERISEGDELDKLTAKIAEEEGQEFSFIPLQRRFLDQILKTSKSLFG